MKAACFPQVVSPYTSSGEHSDQMNDLFDFSKVPDVDQATRTRMGSKCWVDAIAGL